MANSFGTDILIQAQDPKSAAHREDPCSKSQLLIVEEAKQHLVKSGCKIVKDEPHFPRCYVQDPYGLIYNLIS
jgi:hypothetical protein